MFTKIFGKKSNTAIAQVQTTEEVTDKKVIIDSKHIQKDIYTTLDTLLFEVGVNYTRESEIETLKKNLIEFRSENSILYEKIILLKDLGFTSTPATIKQKAELEAREEAVKHEIFALEVQIRYFEKMNRLTKEYFLKYPSFKFVPTKIMDEILKKYNLFLGDTCFYGKEIPMDALEIAKGFISEINESKVKYNITKKSYSQWASVDYRVEKEVPKSNLDNSHTYAQAMWLSDHRSSFHQEREYTSILETFEISNLKIVAPMSHFTIPNIIFEERNTPSVNVPVVKITDRNHLQICVDKLNAKAIEAAKKIAALDPILMLEVPEGYIILKAWDEEADIIEIQNVNLN